MTTTLVSSALPATGLRKSFGDNVVLDGIDLDIAEGTVFSLLGPNGAGKTTAIQIFSTLLHPDGGKVHIGGFDLSRQPDKVRSVIGVTGQFSAVDNLLTGTENLMLMADLHHIARRSARGRVGELLDRFDLADAAGRIAVTYSGGMRRRLDLAMTLIGDPRLIFLDEPTAGLDPEERVRFHNLLGSIGEDVVVILSTHIVSDVTDLCREMAILHKGKVRMTGDPVRAVDALEGRIWRKTIEKAELSVHESRFQVVSTRLYGGRTRLHVFANDRPDGTFERVTPDLEDVYFTVIKGFATADASRSVA